MATPERPMSSSGESITMPKKSKASNTSNKNWADLFEVEIKIPSAMKAHQNDYKPPTSAQVKMLALWNGRPHSPFTDEERAEVLGPIEILGTGSDERSATNRTDHALQNARYLLNCHSLRHLRVLLTSFFQ
jgi:hypothetical protein